jgi:hypothetical protein
MTSKKQAQELIKKFSKNFPELNEYLFNGMSAGRKQSSLPNIQTLPNKTRSKAAAYALSADKLRVFFEEELGPRYNALEKAQKDLALQELSYQLMGEAGLHPRNRKERRELAVRLRTKKPREDIRKEKRLKRLKRKRKR